MPQDFVFVGPSLAAEEVTRILPAATVLPPIRHGDLLRVDPQYGDRVLIIDGLFLQAAPIRHKELLTILDRGVTVAGSSSMGALRAAELWQFGMRGVGEVFDLYRDGVVTGDDEVAIIHCSAEEGYRALSEPLVSIRVSLREATEGGALSVDEAAQLLELARSIPFRSRSMRALEQRARLELDGDVVERLLVWTTAHPKDQKAEDARLLLSMAAAADPALRPRDETDIRPEHVETCNTRAWSHRFGGGVTDGHWVSHRDGTVAAMLLRPDYVAAHRQHVLAGIAGVAVDAGDAETRAVAEARRRGIGPESIAVADGWLTTEETMLPHEEAVARILVRAFGTQGFRGIDAGCMPPSMATPQATAWARKVAAAALRCNSFMPLNEYMLTPQRRHFRPAVVDRLFAELWGCELGDLQAAVWDRGMNDLDTFRRLAEPYTALIKMTGVPVPPAA